MKLRNWKYIGIHHSYSRFGNAQLIDKWHKEKGWEKIGYHFVILNGYINNKLKYNKELDGKIEYGRGLNEIGAHIKGFNKEAIGICLIGNFDISKPTSNQYLSLIKLCKKLMKEHNIKIENIKGHREFGAKKSCPGELFNMSELRKVLQVEKIIDKNYKNTAVSIITG